MNNLIRNQGSNLVVLYKAGEMISRFRNNKETYLIGVNSDGNDIVIHNPRIGLKDHVGYVIEDAFRYPPKNESNS